MYSYVQVVFTQKKWPHAKRVAISIIHCLRFFELLHDGVVGED